MVVVGVAAADLPKPAEGGNHCLDCHPVHYPERGTCTDCHRGFAGTKRLNIAHQGLLAARYAAFTLPEHPLAISGRQLLKDYACRRCHRSGDQGNLLAADLDLAQQTRRPEELEESIRNPVLFMPEFHFYESQRIALVNAILEGGQTVTPPEQEQPTVVHFEGAEVTREFQFEKHCGGCHRALTARFGGLGHGLIGPNLSGIFSEFYPQSFGDKPQRWTVENLEKWLKNPRKVRAFAQMPPLELKQDEFKRICAELQHIPPEDPGVAVQ